jgi:glycosyltransferase involved in cell wall biosynthesis
MQAIGSLMDQGSRAAAVYDLGRVKDQELALLYQNADLYVNLSMEEGFGYPVLEALSFGTPALVTTGSSMLEIAPEGIAQTGLEREDCRRQLIATLGQLPDLRQGARRFDTGRFSLMQIGGQLRQVLEGKL